MPDKTLIMRYQFASFMGCKTFTGAGVYTVTIGGTLSNGDKIVVCGVETVLNATSAASGTAAAAAVKTSLDNNAAVSAKYTIANSSSNVITFTEKTGHYGDGRPSASIVSSAGTIAVATTTAPTTGEEYNLIGEGFTQLAESKNPQEYSRKYVSDKTTRTDLTGFAPQYDYTMDYIDGDKVVAEIANITDNELLGTDAQRNIVAVNLWSDPSGLACAAKKRAYAVIPNQKADGTDALVYSGSMKAAGDFIDGTFNINNNTFTPTA